MTGIIPENSLRKTHQEGKYSNKNGNVLEKTWDPSWSYVIVMVFLATAKNCSRLISWKLMDINRHGFDFVRLIVDSPGDP